MKYDYYLNMTTDIPQFYDFLFDEDDGVIEMLELREKYINAKRKYTCCSEDICTQWDDQICDECEEFIKKYTNPYENIIEIVKQNKNTKGRIFLNMNIVLQNEFFKGDYTDSYISGDDQMYNKELIILLKEKNEKITIHKIKEAFHKVSKILSKMAKYHFSKINYDFDGIMKNKNKTVMKEYNELIEKDITKYKDNECAQIGMMQKLTKKYPKRGEYAEYSSKVYYEEMMNPDSDCVIYDVAWYTEYEDSEEYESESE